jgi:hypothetical protein
VWTLLIVFVAWAALSLLLAAWTLWFQGYIYSEPVDQVYWRAPAAAAGPALVLGLWIFLDSRSPGSFAVFHEYSASRTSPPFDQMTAVYQGQERTYKRYTASGGRIEYRDATQTRMPARPDKIIVKENDQEITFEPDRDAKGNFKTTGSDPLVYRDSKGRVMSEGNPGVVTTFRTGGLLLDLIVHFLFLAVWFVSLWLVLRFQWSHALVQAIIVWLVMLLFVVSPLLRTAAATPSASVTTRVPDCPSKPEAQARECPTLACASGFDGRAPHRTLLSISK